MELKAFLEERYPSLRDNIFGENYPPSSTQQLIASIASAIWLFGLAILLAGDFFFTSTGLRPPPIYETMKENKFVFMIMLFLINSYGNGMLATGAFEIILDGKLLRLSSIYIQIIIKFHFIFMFQI